MPTLRHYINIVEGFWAGGEYENGGSEQLASNGWNYKGGRRGGNPDDPNNPRRQVSATYSHPNYQHQISYKWGGSDAQTGYSIHHPSDPSQSKGFARTGAEAH